MERFFGIPIDPASLLGQTLALLLAVVLGGLIGLNREWRGRAAGLRTHVLVCVGSTLIALASWEFGRNGSMPRPADPSRVAANIVVGIGFLGAGAIVREGMTIRGLTTAASIWTTAAIGLSIGTSPRLGGLAVIATAIVLAALIVLNRLEDLFHLKQPMRLLEVDVQEAEHGPARVLAQLAEMGLVVYRVEARRQAGEGGAESVRRMRLQVRLPGNFDRNRLNAVLAEEPGVVAFQLE